jgi:hypothetical protein
MRSTREGKAHCSDHIDEQPYVAGVLAEIERRESELEEVKRLGAKAVDINGPIVADLISFLQTFGDCTIERLNRERIRESGSVEIAWAYATAMRRAGLVDLTMSRRKSSIVRLIRAWKN